MGGGEKVGDRIWFGMLVLLFGRLATMMFWIAWQAAWYSVLVVDRFH